MRFQLLEFGLVRDGVGPLRISGEQHFYTVAELVGNEGVAHAGHQAHRRVGVPGVVLSTHSYALGATDEREVLAGCRVGSDPVAVLSRVAGAKTNPNPLRAMVSGLASYRARMARSFNSTCRLALVFTRS